MLLCISPAPVKQISGLTSTPSRKSLRSPTMSRDFKNKTFRSTRMKRVSGFTLIELLLVVSILAILTAVILPKFDGLQSKVNHGVGAASADDTGRLVVTYKVTKNKYPDGCKRGRVTLRQTGERPVEYVDRRSGQKVNTTAVRSWWETESAPYFNADPDNWLASTIPTMPSHDARRTA